MKERWRTPSVQVEEFEANEYVAACWQIACAVGAQGNPDYANPDPMPWNTEVTHSHNSDGTGCGWAHSQYITEVSDGVFAVTELGDNDLDARLGKNGWNNLSSTISGVEPGDTIYWTTSLTTGSWWNSNTRTWYHYGTVGQADPDHPNRS